MKTLNILLLLILSVAKSFSQYRVSGLVIDNADKKPIAYATVFLSNTSWAMATTDNGNFNLKRVHPGQYDLIVSCVGYEQYKTSVLINNDFVLPRIELKASNENLKEVQIKTKFKLSPYFGEFKKAFLGTTDFAKQCEIKNPEVLHFEYDYTIRALNVSSKVFLKIENNALGYTISYLLNNFIKNDDEGVVLYEGAASFEEMNGTPEQQLLWKKNRMQTYQGSVMEFLRSLTDNTMNMAGFSVNPVVRQPNPFYNRKKDGTANRYIESHLKNFLMREEFMVKTDQKGVFAITGKGDTCLCVCYSKRNDHVNTVIDIGKRKSLCTVVVFNSQYAFFDYNGVINNPGSVSYEGYFGEKRVGNQLPNDFQPN